MASQLSTLVEGHINVFACDAMHKHSLCHHVVSVCLSVHLSRSWTVSKWINISSKFFHHWDYFSFFHIKHHGNILTGASNAGEVVKNHYSQRISGYWIDDWRSANDNCDTPPCSLPHRPPHISESFFIIANLDNLWREENRTEFICI